MNTPLLSNECIVLINFDKADSSIISNCNLQQRQLLHFNNTAEMISGWQTNPFNAVAIFSKSEVLGNYGINIIEILDNKDFPRIPVFLFISHFNENLRQMAMNGRIADVFESPLIAADIETRVNFTIENWESLQRPFIRKENTSYKTPIGKRVFDILFSGAILLFLSPLFLIIYLIIRITSPGPAFYYSYRVGTGYRIFKFYKFRSMYINADKRLQDLQHLNLYNENNAVNDSPQTLESNLCGDCQSYGKCQFPLYADNVTMCEKEYIKSSSVGSAFIKIKDDPRVTKIGNFIRNSSIDELPQLWNVLIGNMSIVGNRPLPLYEAEKLTTDKYSLRFYAPAGITGLWQVEKRGKSDMSEEERLLLDNSYALNHSFKNDLLVIVKTIPALLQSENV
ncbi:MAG TPA: sugar transferase [Mucilaginibacter sp.]|jgi:lipopolysaccharide/colanic/teichoic acid biosynthesis glycosyltransferase|nr:sugar transferase [Mucilaginibacter sp.]